MLWGGDISEQVLTREGWKVLGCVISVGGLTLIGIGVLIGKFF